MYICIIDTHIDIHIDVHIDIHIDIHRYTYLEYVYVYIYMCDVRYVYCSLQSEPPGSRKALANAQLPRRGKSPADPRVLVSGTK